MADALDATFADFILASREARLQVQKSMPDDLIVQLTSSSDQGGPCMVSCLIPFWLLNGCVHGDVRRAHHVYHMEVETKSRGIFSADDVLPVL